MNPRVLETKTLLSDALLDLLETEMISEISVSELCRRAQVNRSTFYRYYRTPYDLLLELLTRMIDVFEAQKNDCSSDRDMLIGVLSTIRSQPKLNLALNEVYLRETFAGRIAQHPRDYMRRIFLDRMEENTALYFSAIQSSVLEKWLTSGHETPEEIADLLLKIAESTGKWKQIKR